MKNEAQQTKEQRDQEAKARRATNLDAKLDAMDEKPQKTHAQLVAALRAQRRRAAVRRFFFGTYRPLVTSMFKSYKRQGRKLALMGVKFLVRGRVRDAFALFGQAAHLYGNAQRVDKCGLSTEAYVKWLGDSRLPYNGKGL